MSARSWTVWLPGKWPGYTQIAHNPGHFQQAGRIKRAWQEPAGLILKAARIPRLARVRLLYRHHRRDRRTDKSNLASAAMKILEDAMVDAGIIRDDGWNFVESFAHEFVLGSREGIELVITEAAATATDDAA